MSDVDNSFEAKSLLPLKILYILSKYTNEDNRILASSTARDKKPNKVKNGTTILANTVQDYLRSEFGIDMDRKAISRYLKALVDYDSGLGYYVECDRITRTVKGIEQVKYTNFYYVPGFNSGSLQLLIDHVLFAKNLPSDQANEIVKNLRKLGGGLFYQQKRNSNIEVLNNTYHSDKKDLLYNVEFISNAISKGQRILFTYNEYRFNDEKKKPELLPVADRSNPILVSPLQMLIDHEVYYLLANVDGEKGIAHFQISLMTNIKLVKGGYVDKNHTDLGWESLQEHLGGHTFMSEGKTEMVTLRVNERLLGFVMKDFGNTAKVERDKKNPEKLLVRVRSAEEDLIQWALIHSEGVEILKPDTFRNDIERRISKLTFTYRQLLDEEKNTIEIQKFIKNIGKGPSDGYHFSNMDLTGQSLKNVPTEGVRIIGIDSCKGFDFDILRNFKSCERLTLQDLTIPSLEFLKDMPALKYLQIHWCTVETPTGSLLSSLKIHEIHADTKSVGVDAFYHAFQVKHLTIFHNTNDSLDYQEVRRLNSEIFIQFCEKLV